MASEKEKLTGALSRIRTCDPPLRRRMLYPTELPGHRDIVPEPKECPIRVQPVPGKASCERDDKPGPMEYPISVQPAVSGQKVSNRCGTEPTIYTINVQPVPGKTSWGRDVKPNPRKVRLTSIFTQQITSQERDTKPESKEYPINIMPFLCQQPIRKGALSKPKVQNRIEKKPTITTLV